MQPVLPCNAQFHRHTCIPSSIPTFYAIAAPQIYILQLSTDGLHEKMLTLHIKRARIDPFRDCPSPIDNYTDWADQKFRL